MDILPQVRTLPCHFSEVLLLMYMRVNVRSGYDFGYFVKLLTAESLPTTEEMFFERLRKWFPTIYDIKFVMRACKVLKGGLQDVADDLGVRTPSSLSPLFPFP